jgi:hypothetical protein
VQFPAYYKQVATAKLAVILKGFELNDGTTGAKRKNASKMPPDFQFPASLIIDSYISTVHSLFITV